MSSYFYLSYAPADNSELLEKFFKDLSFAVQASLRPSEEERVGFFDRRGITDADSWPPEIAKALRTSQTMVALISPHYFQGEQAGKEWQIFETRRRLKTESLSARELRPPAIIPVIWSPCDDAARTVMEQTQFGWDESFKIYRLNGLIGLMKLGRSLPSFEDEYVKVLVTLAQQIIELARTVRLPPLDDGSPNGVKLKAAIIDDNQQVRDMLVEYLSALGYYDCHAYWEAETALQDILSCQHQPSTFDVVLLDLELEHNVMQGLSLIERLTVDDNSPPIIAMSPGLTNSEFIHALKAGADDVVPKPFDVFQIESRIGTLARIGQTRRLRRQEGTGSGELVVKKRERPVFLSYSNRDRRTATMLKAQIESRGIGVWYAPDNLDTRGPIAEGISRGLDSTHVFVPLITDNYSRSPWCAFEMARSQSDPTKSSLVIPVLDGLLHRIRNFELLKPITDKFVCDITFDRFADGVTALLGHIRQAVDKHQSSRKI